MLLLFSDRLAVILRLGGDCEARALCWALFEDLVGESFYMMFCRVRSISIGVVAAEMEGSS